MKFNYLNNQNTLEPIPILINMLEQFKDKLKKYKCLEIGGGMVRIEKAKLFLFATTALKNKTLFYFLTVIFLVQFLIQNILNLMML
jgi:hypothetical protein